MSPRIILFLLFSFCCSVAAAQISADQQALVLGHWKRVSMTDGTKDMEDFPLKEGQLVPDVVWEMKITKKEIVSYYDGHTVKGMYEIVNGRLECAFLDGSQPTYTIASVSETELVLQQKCIDSYENRFYVLTIRYQRLKK